MYNNKNLYFKDDYGEIKKDEQYDVTKQPTQDNKNVKPKYLTFNEKLNKLTDTSSIRIQKLLEMTQYIVVYFFIGIIIGLLLEKIFPYDDETSVKNRTIYELFILILIQAIVFGLSSFYIHKVAKLVPFIFHYDTNYIPNYKGEAGSGGGVALALIMYGIQASMIKRISEFTGRVRAI